MVAQPIRWFSDERDLSPWLKTLEDVRRQATWEGWCYWHVQAIIVAIDQYAEAATGNREYFLSTQLAGVGRAATFLEERYRKAVIQELAAFEKRENELWHKNAESAPLNSICLILRREFKLFLASLARSRATERMSKSVRPPRDLPCQRRARRS